MKHRTPKYTYEMLLKELRKQPDKEKFIRKCRRELDKELIIAYEKIISVPAPTDEVIKEVKSAQKTIAADVGILHRVAESEGFTYERGK